ncbi:hypothetical protein MSG28_013596 [Choristoneura fumiferana]|uniref:Uncharacterized protein n=1 Tax=Choristoneura fumiferana TaxID=7141 RepID=A0ACC0K8L8_CHOFU|nr:hypothetical protein MSG28_013596 [Choristoneura fumiferana]
MPEPTVNDWLNISEGFYNRTNFPNCLGAVDGKHIRLEKPNGAGSEFYNYKQYNSIVLMAVVDSNYTFTMIDVGAYGSGSDSTIFKRTNFAKKSEADSLNIPQSRCLPNDTNGPDMPFVLVGDEAFALSKHVMRPYPRKNLSVKQRVFNYRLSRARRMVEIFEELPLEFLQINCACTVL